MTFHQGMAWNLPAGGVIHGLAAQQPLSNGRSVVKGWLAQLFAKRYEGVFSTFGLFARYAHKMELGVFDSSKCRLARIPITLLRYR
jgi:hypothetical protein